MKHKKIFILLVLAIAVSIVTATIVLADEGQMFRRNVSRLPDGETLYASIGMMHVYVPAQKADRTFTDIEYYAADGSLVETRDMAKPLIAGYVDEPYAGEEGFMALYYPDAYAESTSPIIQGGVEFGLSRDAFAAVSFDDGATWKDTNLSKSSDLSSFYLKNGYAYPGDVHYMPYLAVEGRTTTDGDEYYVLAAWISKYCSGGSPAYTWVDEDGGYIYEDYFGVAGSQVSVDYTLQGHPEVGEIPYGCVWTARGSLEDEVDENGSPTGAKEILWRKAERLTSGRRDANLVQTAGVPGAGFVMVWQEDPAGLRPGQGLGPGEGWSGAVVNQKTDMWYSYISWDDFALNLEDRDTDNIPKVAVPFSVPVRITDNNLCKDGGSVGDGTLEYCFTDFSEDPPVVYEGPHEDAICSETVSWDNPGGTTLNVCKTSDGRLLQGRQGASRVRLSLQGYTNIDGDTSAWLIMAYEESKALGAELDPETGDPIDIGKNIWYHSFDMFKPDLVAQGKMLNQPGLDPATGDELGTIVDEWENEVVITDISRRFALMAQPLSKFHNTPGPTSGTSVIAIFKQGADRQGGPADIMLRRFVIPAAFNPAVDNPYAPENMVCDGEVLYDDESNPNYLQGICTAPPINVSGTMALTCADGDGVCPIPMPDPVQQVGWPRVTEWTQTADNLDDEWWGNPYDVAKGHRGFIDGDFVMMMYAWSPNWNQNAVGNDKYNLYVRRSFDGGQTWTTTPASYTHWDNANWTGEGTNTCENWGYGNDQYPECTDYGAGDFEKARNVSQLTGSKVTILDPRFTPTSGPKAAGDILTDGGYLYPNDKRDPSKFFIIYETGDNTTVEFGEADPLNLYYSRALNWGDEYYEVEYYNQNTKETYYAWDWLENQAENMSGEAAVWSDPGGQFFYAVWNQWREDDDGHVHDSDVWFRRVMWLDDEAASDVSTPPFARVLYASHTYTHADNTEITFVGSATAFGATEITGWKWRSSIDGDLSTEKSMTMRANQLRIGKHTIYLSAQDSNDLWSKEVSVELQVGSKIYMPLIRR